MGSKINTSYWGSNVSPTTSGSNTMSYGVSSNTIRALIANGKYDPNTDSFDLSVSPWGIGYSAAGNRGQIVLLRNGTRDGAAPGVFTKIMFDGMDKENSNRPFALINKNHYFRDSFRWLQSRVGGDITVDSENYMKNAAVAYGSEYLSENSKTDGCLSLARVATYLDYQKYKLRVTGFSYINLDTGQVSGYSFNRNETVEDAKARFNNFSFPEHMAIIGIEVNMIGYAAYEGSPTGWDDYVNIGADGNGIQLRGHSIGSCINFNQITPTADDDTKFKLCFTWSLGLYNNSYLEDAYATVPYRYWSTDTAAQCFPVEGMNYRTGGQPTYNRILVNGLGFSTDDQYRNTNMAGNFCDKEQSFGDITYKQRPLLYRVVNSQLTEVKEGDAVVYDTYQYYKLVSIYEVSGSDTFTKDQILALIKHEVAFYGFEFYICWGDARGGTFAVGSDDLYLPKFDEHLITTGMYTSGAASLSEPNASWGNVFDDTMPEYDSEYNPSPQPGPGGGETPWDDNPITRIQEGYWTGFGGNTYVSSVNDFEGTFEDVQAIMGQDLATISDTARTTLSAFLRDGQEAQWDAYERAAQCLQYAVRTNSEIFTNGVDTNYTDCVLSVLRYPFDISDYFHRDGSSTTIKWGNAWIGESTDYNIWHVDGYQTGQIVQGGTLYVEKKYDNFLNYAPYTTAELYIPYCGSVPIDLEVFAGHTINVKYLIDWFSGECLALIYRDSVVVDQITGQIGTPVSIVAADIQSYKNAMFNGSQTLKAQKAALRGSIVNGMGQSMDQISGAIGNVATAILGGEPSSSNSQSGGGAFAGGFGTGNAIAQNYQNVKTAKYNLDHTTIDFKQIGSNGPSVGSWNEQVCRLVLYYPTFLPEYNPSEYGHTVGFACLFNKTLSEFSGLTVCSSVDTSGLTDATESEKTLIEDALKSGVYL